MKRLIAAVLAALHIAAPSVQAAPVTGTASWYHHIAGQAAAGPALRRMLGPTWRGRVVRVCGNGRCVKVKLTDWCQCYKDTARERIVDLDVRSFAVLFPPSRGVGRVTVTR